MFEHVNLIKGKHEWNSEDRVHSKVVLEPVYLVRSEVLNKRVLDNSHA